MRALEAELGVPLFKRVNQCVVLTPAGQQPQRQLQQAFAMIATASAEVQLNATREPATLLRTTGSCWLVSAPVVMEATGAVSGRGQKSG